MQVLGIVVTGIVWLVWLHQAYGNLGQVGTKKSRFTPGWAVGYWFVPFVNLVRPYQIVLDLWLRSDQLNSRESVTGLPRPAAVSLWWGFYLISGFGGRIYAIQAREAKAVIELVSVTDMGMIVDGISVVAALLAITVVRGIDRRQAQIAVPSANPG